MKIIDLNEEHKQLYFECLEDWSDEIKEGSGHRACWFEKMKDKGLGVKLAKDDKGNIGGMIQYIPIEHSPAEGQDLYFIPCIWVHGHKKGRGNFQKKGMGKALLKAAEEDVHKRGAKGLVAWGVSMPFWMRASWYKKQGYKKVDNLKGGVLLWKPFSDTAIAPRWIKPKMKPQSGTDKVLVTAFINGSCTAQGMVYERAKRAAAEFENCVEFRGVDTSNRTVFLEWGIYDGLFINDKPVRTGPPPSYKKIRKKIAKQVKKLS